MWECQACPVRAQCKGGCLVLSQAGYFGTRAGSSVVLDACPQGYCAEAKLDDYTQHRCVRNACIGGRDSSSRLCGACIAGSSSSLGSVHCSLNTNCTALWFWPVTVLGAIVFALWLLFDPRSTFFVAQKSRRGALAQNRRTQRCRTRQ